MTTTTDQPRTGDWLLTRSGKHVYPLDPKAEDFDLGDIAIALSNLCRFAGHCTVFHSVASHALLVSELVAPLHPGLALAALHHDDAEAYIADIPRPVKRFLLMVWGKRTLNADNQMQDTRNEATIHYVEQRLLRVIFESLGIAWPDEDGWAIITRADNAILRAEAQQIMPRAEWTYSLPDPPEFLHINQDPPPNREVASAFIYRHHLLSGRAAR